MRADTLEILRCPYCGGRLDLVESLFHVRDGDEIRDGILGCRCCIFAVVDGIPVLHLLDASTRARDEVLAGRPERARRILFGIESDEQAERFESVASRETATYRETVEAFGPNFEGGYFLYRFSDPTFVVAQAVVRSVGRAVLGGGGRAIDLCGGSGHLTRSLLDLAAAPPVVADLYFAKIWLARRFTAPGCEPVCCDGNAPMPFARGAFALAMCIDAFMFIWTKRQFVGEMARLIEPPDGDRAAGGAVLIGHTHNERAWSPSHGQPLPPEGYAELFETMEPRIFGEAGLFTDVVDHGVLDLTRRDSAETLDADPALTIVASRRPDVFERRPVETPATASGEFCLNPLYAADAHLPHGDQAVRTDADADAVRLRLRFPDAEYEQEYGAGRRYLPEEISVSRADLDTLPSRTVTGRLAELARRRVVLDLPKRYY